MKTTDHSSLFRSLDERGEGAVTRADIAARFERSGIALSDARLTRLAERLEGEAGDSFDEATLLRVINGNAFLAERVIQSRLVIPDFEAFGRNIREIFETVAPIGDGAVADYIPQLARVAPDRFAVAVCTVDGQRLGIGDIREGFTLQSSCKPILYSAALEEHGEAAVHGHVGREPSGLSFNELTLNRKGLPHNPMINAGAIMTSSLIRRDLPLADRLDHLGNTVAALSGNQPPGFNNAVFHSERETADRNFALAHHMRERGAFPRNTDLHATLDFYFSACSIEVNASAMASIAATLANGGISPLTDERVFGARTVKNCLSMMYSCGMYDYSGEFAFTVGLPAKSSVSGVVIAVVPNVAGIAVWSPRLDTCGNSVRGVEFLKRVVDRFCFHTYDNMMESTKVDPRRVRQEVETGLTFQAIYAASIGDVDELKRLVAHGHDLDSADYDGRTPLHLAAAEGRIKAVHYLLGQGAAAGSKDRWGHTPADDATRHGHSRVAAMLASPLAA